MQHVRGRVACRGGVLGRANGGLFAPSCGGEQVWERLEEDVVRLDDEDVPLVLENVSYGNDVRVLELSENVDLAVQHLGAVELGLGDGLRARGVSNVPDGARSTRKETS